MQRSNSEPKHRHRVFGILYLSAESARELRRVLVGKLGVPDHAVKPNLHLTVYESRRMLEGLEPFSKHVRVEVQAKDLRFMVVAPGGENPRPDLDPATRPLALRVRRDSAAYTDIQKYRSQFLAFESPRVLAGRSPSGPRKSAFGSHHYQPHITVCSRAHGLTGDLRPYGDILRTSLGSVTFNRLVCRVHDNTGVT